MTISPSINLNFNGISKTDAFKSIKKVILNAEPKEDISYVGVFTAYEFRQYQDKLSDIGFSFQSPTLINPSRVPSSIASHEYEHVINNRIAVKKNGDDILFQNVSMQTSLYSRYKYGYIAGIFTKAITVYRLLLKRLKTFQEV